MTAAAPGAVAGGDLFAAVVELVSEPDMSAEVAALVDDALARMAGLAGPSPACPCRCLRRLVLRPGSSCLWCGRRPA